MLFEIGYLQSCTMKLFVGLGNPGENYSKNRHNIGFMVVDAIVNHYEGSAWKKKFQGMASEVTLHKEKIIFLKPSTFMNLSGQSVGEASRFYKIQPSEICVFHDELDLPFLKIKTKIGGGHAGHNGLRSIQQHLGPDYFRVRVGIGHPGEKAQVASYVLNNFPKNNEADLSILLESVSEGFPELIKGKQENFLNIINRNRNSIKKIPDDKKVATSNSSRNPVLDKNDNKRKTTLQRLIEKFR
jgi:PTH1 family peptidyl-tRNA hydrolase